MTLGVFLGGMRFKGGGRLCTVYIQRNCPFGEDDLGSFGGMRFRGETVYCIYTEKLRKGIIICINRQSHGLTIL